MSSMLKRALLIGLTPWLFVTGCFGGDTGTEGDWPLCGVRGAETPVGEEAETQHGTPRALAERSMVASEVSLTYWQIKGGESVQSSTTAHVRVLAEPRTARLVAYRDRSDKQRVCQPALEMDAWIEIESADGAFRERLEGSLSGHAPAASARGDYTARKGSYQTEAFAGQKKLEYSAHIALEDAAPDTPLSNAHWKGGLFLEAPELKNAVSATVAEW